MALDGKSMTTHILFGYLVSVFAYYYNTFICYLKNALELLAKGPYLYISVKLVSMHNLILPRWSYFLGCLFVC